MARSASRGRNRKTITYLWVFALAILTGFLVYKEQTALLYIVATLGVTAILVIVALADLSPGEHSGDSPPAN